MRKPRIYPTPRAHPGGPVIDGMALNPGHPRCTLCGRPLDVATDPLSTDCGGDCWGCMGAIEAEGGDRESRAKVGAEIAAGLRTADGEARPRK